MEIPAVGSYDFAAPGRIVFGWGRLPELGPLAAGLGRRAFVVFGSKTLADAGLSQRISELLRADGVESVELATISHEPEVDDVDQLAGQLRCRHAGAGDLVIGVGGGSAIDLAKAVAALATNTMGSSVRDYLEGVGAGLKITAPPLPMIAVPTTAGTGSEATKNAVISCYDPPFKKSLRSDQMVPRVVLVDPELTVSLPPRATAHTGMDAITQLIESFISRRAKPMPRALAVDGLRLALPAIEQAVEHGTSRAARGHVPGRATFRAGTGQLGFGNGTRRGRGTGHALASCARTGMRGNVARCAGGQRGGLHRAACAVGACDGHCSRGLSRRSSGRSIPCAN